MRDLLSPWDELLDIEHRGFDLDGVEFGRIDSNYPILTNGLDFGEIGFTTQDTQVPGSDVVMFGRDSMQPRTWVFTIAIRPLDGRSVWVHLNEVAAAWNAVATRTVPGASVALRMNRDGHVQTVHGRPRSFKIDPQQVWADDFATVQTSFTLGDPTVYDDTENEAVFTLGRVATEGWLLPSDLPWPDRTGLGGDPWTIHNGSAVVRPVIEFRGDPALETPKLVLTVGGSKLALREPLRPNSVVIVDTRTAAVTVDGEPANAFTTSSSTDLVLPPGDTRVQFYAYLNTRATATIRWHTGNLV